MMKSFEQYLTSHTLLLERGLIFCQLTVLAAIFIFNSSFSNTKFSFYIYIQHSIKIIFLPIEIKLIRPETLVVL